MSTTALAQTAAPQQALAFIRPTRRTLFWRTFLPWQLIRFLIINLRITGMILRSHDTRLRR